MGSGIHSATVKAEGAGGLLGFVQQSSAHCGGLKNPDRDHAAFGWFPKVEESNGPWSEESGSSLAVYFYSDNKWNNKQIFGYFPIPTGSHQVISEEKVIQFTAHYFSHSKIKLHPEKSSGVVLFNRATDTEQRLSFGEPWYWSNEYTFGEFNVSVPFNTLSEDLRVSGNCIHYYFEFIDEE